ncbi:hypothetical protein BD769DRAFT_1374346 [Suillus cothurnatus]|nr:hypothetical protein BD769DRAFT_1374346 [Suillus cothurnatus]
MHASWHLQLPALTNAYLTWKHNSSLNVAQTSAHKFQVTAVHVFGTFFLNERFCYLHFLELDYFHDITQQHEEVANVSLLHVGLLGCSPTAPTVAISLQCLELYHQLRRRQSSFSIQAFTKVLCAIHNVNYAQTFRDQFSIAFDIYLTILRSVRSQVDTALGRTDPDWRLRHGCPPCTFEVSQPNECPLYPASLKAMDGNNSAKRMANAGSADLRIFPSRYMIPPDQVDVFKDDVRLRPGERGADQLTFCTDNWKAANSTEENTVRVFEQTGIFLSACRHGIIQTVTEMRRSGELAKYPLATINKLLDVFGDNQAIGSDIGCSLSKTVAASSIRDKAFNHKLSLSVNAFHGHAHNRKCQLQYHPMYLRGFGLEDLETCERIFASSNAAACLIRHASHFHYSQFLDLHFDQWDMDKYLELSRFIFNNYKQAVTLIDDFTKELDAYRLSFPDQAMDFETWVTEELAYLESIASEPARDALVVDYVEALEKLNTYHVAASQSTKQAQAARRAVERRLQIQINIVEDLETRLDIAERWTPGYSDYRETLEYSRRRKFIRAVEDLEGLVVQRLFELSKANLSSTGYKLRRQISRAIVKRSGAIRTALDKYNKLAVVQNPRRPTLQYSEILSYADLGEFDILKHSRHDILTKPWSNTTHRQMGVKYFKILRAREEITRLNVETRRLHAWIDAEDSDIKHVATELELTNPPLASEIWRLYHRQRRVNDVHRVRLNRIYSLEGFTGCVPSDVTATDDSLDSVDEVSVEMIEDELEGDEAARFDLCIQQMSL